MKVFPLDTISPIVINGGRMIPKAGIYFIEIFHMSMNLTFGTEVNLTVFVHVRYALAIIFLSYI